VLGVVGVHLGLLGLALGLLLAHPEHLSAAPSQAITALP
jgi:hypothetical protein